MRNIVGICVILAFLPVCASFGDVGQAQGYLLGAENYAVLAGGPAGGAQSTNVAVVGNYQKSTDPYNFVTALQSENGVLVQGALAVGMNGLFTVGQAANLVGGQLQAAGAGPSIQDQFLNATFDQNVAKIGGIGAALGLQGFIGVDVQIIISPHGADTNVQYVGLGLLDSVAGGP